MIHTYRPYIYRCMHCTLLPTSLRALPLLLASPFLPAPSTSSCMPIPSTSPCLPIPPRPFHFSLAPLPSLSLLPSRPFQGMLIKSRSAILSSIPYQLSMSFSSGLGVPYHCCDMPIPPCLPSHIYDVPLTP